jgi:hypothetical protein
MPEQLTEPPCPLLVLCIDVEEDFDWGAPFSRDEFGLGSVSALPKMVQWLNQRGVEPTLLVDYPVLADAASARLLAGIDADDNLQADFGTQLHAWVTPPFIEALSSANSYAGNLPEPTERAKLEILTRAYEKVFQRPPSTYRAGRFGMGPNTPDILGGLNYRLDLSIFAGRDFTQDSGPDYRDQDATPFKQPGLPGLVFAPAVSGPSGTLARLGGWLGKLLNPKAGTLLYRLCNRGWSWISPEGVPLHRAKAVTRELAKTGQKVFIVTFHSPSLVPGNTPYVHTEDDLAKLHAWLEDYINFFINDVGGKPATAKQLHKILSPK